MALQFILKENVLTDNLVIVAEHNKIFKGGYIAIIKEYVYQNAWQDKETIKRFKSKDRLFSYLDKNYDDLDIDFYGTCLTNQ